MVNQFYTDRSSGEQVQIIKEESNFLLLNNNVRIKKDIFYKKYEEAVNPDAFLSTSPLYDAINKLKEMDTSKISDDDNSVKINYKPATVLSDTSMSKVLVKDPQYEDTENIVLSQQQKDAMLEDWRRKNSNAPVAPIDAIPLQEENNNIEYEKPKPDIVNKKQEVKVDPMQMMFAMFKNNYPVKISISIDEMIANPAFIGMIQENVDADAIEYYSKIIMDKVMKEPLKLKSEIYNQLKNIVDKELGKTDETKNKE